MLYRGKRNACCYCDSVTSRPQWKNNQQIIPLWGFSFPGDQLWHVGQQSWCQVAEKAKIPHILLSPTRAAAGVQSAGQILTYWPLV